MNKALNRKIEKAIAFLQEQRTRFGTFERLAEEIRIVTGETKAPIDRRKLAELITGDPTRVAKIHLTLNEVAALDLFMQRRGGFSGVMRLPSVLENVAAVGRITFLMGSKSIETSEHHRLDFISRWDMLAVSHLLRTIDRIRPNVQIEIRDVRLFTEDPTPRSVRFSSAQENPDWRQRLQDEIGAMLTPSVPTSYICCGSSRANHAAEIMLARMHSVPPFKPPTWQDNPLPYLYVWSAKECRETPSALAISSDELTESDRARFPTGSSVRAMRIQGKLLPLEQQHPHWTTYGVCAAQRRADGSVWLVLGGAEGPATYACATQAELMEIDWPPPQDNRRDPAAWMAVAADIVRDTSPGVWNNLGDRRRMENPRVLVGESIEPTNWISPA